MIGKTEESKECSNNFDIDYVDVDDFLTNKQLIKKYESKRYIK